MQIIETIIPGCFEILPTFFKDERGIFLKTLHEEIYRKKGLITNFKEEYYSASREGVLRGLHFQLPPKDHTKLVYCVHGKVMDVVVDVRIGSPTFGKFEIFELSAESGRMLYIPPGLAHGFYSLSDNSILMYKVSSVYAPEYDSGILWNSLNIPWPDKNPIISARDRNLPAFETFKSPFTY